MAAVIGLDAVRVVEIIEANGLQALDLANLNSPTQIVIAGPVDDLKRAKPIFEKSGARRYLPLDVSGAFHSRYVAQAARAFSDYLAPISFNAPAIPVIADVTARPYPTEGSSNAVRSLLVEQIIRPVQWLHIVRYLVGEGVDNFMELGPGNVLTRLVREIA
jgi:malonyl CoA-acyl carrier protein transacylase